MSTKVTFAPCPVKGEVTITMDSILAGKLCHLLGMCNGSVFTSIYDELTELDIEHGTFKGLPMVNLYEHTFVQN